MRQSLPMTNKDKSSSTMLDISPIACRNEDESMNNESIFRKLLESQTRYNNASRSNLDDDPLFAQLDDILNGGAGNSN